MDSAPSNELLRLSCLRVHKFGNAGPANLRFGNGVTILLGCNGTGKTSLLNLITMLVSGDFSPIRTTHFDLEYTLELGLIAIEVRIRNAPEVRPDAAAKWKADKEWTPTHPRSEAKLVAHWDRETNDWSCTLRVLRDKRLLGQVDISPGQTADVRLKYGSPFEEGIRYASILHPFIDTISSAGHILQSLWSAVHCSRMDEALDLYADIVGHDRTSVPTGGRRVRPNLEIRQYMTNEKSQRRSPPSSDFYTMSFRMGFLPDSFFNDAASYYDNPKLGGVHLDSAKLPFLSKFKSLCDYAEASATLALSRRTVETHAGTNIALSTFDAPSFQFVTRNGSTLTHDHLSFGQKRLLTFLYYAQTIGAPIVADELVNGLHHSWISFCVEQIAGQAFLSSQNPLLFDFMEFPTIDAVMERFVLCGNDTRGNWMWKNISRQQAEGFFRAYNAGFQQVGEILRTLELW